MNKLIFTLSLINLALWLGIIFWAINKNCSQCHQEMNPKRVFTFKDKCQDCERSPLAFAKDKERRTH